MAQIVKLRRSSVSGQKPTNSNLQLGELALNTTDGKVFLAKSGSLGPSVEELISTNTVNTGSVTISGSFNLIGDEHISGALILNPITDPDPTGTSISSPYIFASGSNVADNNDIYFRHNVNLLKLNWLEGKLHSGILYGGALSYSGSTINVSSGSGIIVNYNANDTSEISPDIKYISWGNLSATDSHITGSEATYVYINQNGQLQQQSTYFTNDQYRTSIPLGAFMHINRSTITSTVGNYRTAYGDTPQMMAFIDSVGPIKVNGLSLSGQSGTLRVDVAAGTAFGLGNFFQTQPNYPSHKDLTATQTALMARIYRNVSGEYISDNNSGSFYNVVDPTKYDNGSGTLQNVPNKSYTIQRIFMNPLNKRLSVYYGQRVYDTLIAAQTGLPTDQFNEAEFSAKHFVFLGYLIVREDATDLTNSTSNLFINAGIFRNTIGSSGTNLVLPALDDLTDVTITSRTIGDLVVYNGTDFVNTKNLSGSYVITGSLGINGTDISGSLSSLNNFTSSISSSLNTVSNSLNTRIDTVTGSIYIVASELNSRINTISGSVHSLNDFSSSVVLTSQTSSMSVMTASYALTAAFALNALGTGQSEGRTALLEQTSASTTWTFSHFLGEQYPAVTVYDSSNNVIIPTNINAQDANTLVLTFTSPTAGYATATVGGGIPAISQSYNGRVLAVVDNAPSWKTGIISGSLQISNLGFTTTGSNSYNGTQTISGSLIVNNAKIGATNVTVSSNTQIFDLAGFDGAFFDYVVKNGVNMRAGSIASVWDGSNSSYNETTTNDLGDTTGVAFNVSGTGKLNANISSGTWTIEVLYRALGNNAVAIEPTPTPTISGPTPTPSSTPGPTPTINPNAGTWDLYVKSQAITSNPNSSYNLFWRINNGAWEQHINNGHSVLGYELEFTNISVNSGTTISFAFYRNGVSGVPIEFGAGNNGPYSGYCGFDNPYVHTFNGTQNQGIYLNIPVVDGDFVSCTSVYPTPTPTP